jgi:glycerophosphoryl diester phosphodiesterase
MLEPLIIGHRGASAVAPENTLIPFKKAIADGADGIEFDVQLARDGVPVVIHDTTLKRTGLRQGLVADQSSVELERIDVGSWFNLRYPSRAQDEFASATVPSLAAVLDFFRSSQSMLYIEMKCGPRESRALAAEVVHLIHKHKVSRRAVVESFALESIREIKRLDPGISTAALFEPKLTRPVRSRQAMIEETLSCETNEIALHRTLATSRTVEEAKRRGLNVVVWTADHSSWIRRALKNGIHAIITNRPGLMCATRREMSTAPTIEGRVARIS